MHDFIGEQLGQYHLISLIGKGGFAEVYLGKHTRLHTLAAIKVLRAHLSSETELLTFQREARVIAQLNHPHIIRVLDFDERNGIPFLVMSYYPDGTLRKKHMKAEKVVLPVVVSYVQQIADALHYAHSHKIVHRDVKPENMLIGQQGDILLGDFGIASVAHSTSSIATQVPTGTIPYMAPEQIQAYACPASDQYSLAIVTYEWLCGKRPFNGTYAEILSKHLMVVPPPLRNNVPDLPLEVEQVVMKALEKKPKQRFPSILHYAEALEGASRGKSKRFYSSSPHAAKNAIRADSRPDQVMSTVLPPLPSTMKAPTINVPLTATEPVFSTRQSMVTRRHSPGISQPVSIPHAPSPIQHKKRVSRRTFLIGGLTIAGLGITGLGVEVVERYAVISGHIFTYFGHNAEVAVVAWSPDSKRIASGSGYGDAIVHVWDAISANQDVVFKDHQAKDMNTIDTELQTISWSPDGTQIVTASLGSTTLDVGISFIWNPNNMHDKVQRLQGNIHAAAWSPDGKYIATNAEDVEANNTTRLWDIHTQNFVNIAEVNAFDFFSCITWSPDNKYIAGNPDGYVEVWDVFNKNIVFTCGTGREGAVHAVAWSPDGKYLASANDDTFVQIWDAQNGTHLFTYKGHSSVVNSVAWSPNSKQLVSGSSDGTAQVWNPSNGKLVFTYTGHSGAINTVAWSPDGKNIASGGKDSTVQVWKIP